jgi:Spy/CpxP family protein refolding chaperone
MQNARAKSEAGLLVLVVFVLGVLVGGVGNHLWDAHVISAGRPGNGHPPGTSLSQLLQLTSDQQKQLDAIFNDSRPQLQALDAQHNALRAQTRARIRAILTPDQQVKFDAMTKDQDSHGRGPNRGPGPPPGAGPPPSSTPHPGP